MLIFKFVAQQKQDISSGEEDRSPVAESPLPPPTKIVRSDSNGYNHLIVPNPFRQSPAQPPQAPLVTSPTSSASQTGILQPPPLTPVVPPGAMPALSSISSQLGWMYPDAQQHAHTTSLLPFQMQDNVYETAARLLFMVCISFHLMQLCNSMK